MHPSCMLGVESELDHVDAEGKPGFIVHCPQSESYDPSAMARVTTEQDLLSIASALGPECVSPLSEAERSLLSGTPRSSLSSYVARARRLIAHGRDPLGDAFTRLRTPVQRRPSGATYTPLPIVHLMLDWAAEQGLPARVVDPGIGSGRFLVAAGRRFPKAELVGIEVDPVAAILARAHLNAAGMAPRSQVLLGDYRSVVLPKVAGRTLFIGNPPYVRHHLISEDWKRWLVEGAKRLRIHASQLAGLHAHFFLATALNGTLDDFGAFITSAEWLDVNYGRLIRELFVGKLGGRDLVVLEPTTQAFPDAATTAAITTFVVGSRPATVRLSRVDSLDEMPRLTSGRPVHRDRLINAARWTHLTRAQTTAPADYVELGELCRVHRGAVTGANKIWIAGEHSRGLPASVLFRSVTKARELLEAGHELRALDRLRSVIDIPVDLDAFETAERTAIEGFLKHAKVSGADRSYVARHRRAWWAIGLRTPPPIMATYMARRPPAFVRNRAGARYINIAHGLYPRVPLDDGVLSALVRYLSSAATVVDGRTYAGGLTKYEPREMERILVPTPEMLAVGEFDDFTAASF